MGTSRGQHGHFSSTQSRRERRTIDVRVRANSVGVTVWSTASRLDSEGAFVQTEAFVPEGTAVMFEIERGDVPMRFAGHVSRCGWSPETGTTGLHVRFDREVRRSELPG